MRLVKAKRKGRTVYVNGRPFYTNDIVEIPAEWMTDNGWEVLEGPARLTEPAPSVPAAKVATPAKEPTDTEPSIEWTRAQLDEHATKLGLDPSKATKKQDVLDLIQAAG